MTVSCRDCAHYLGNRDVATCHAQGRFVNETNAYDGMTRNQYRGARRIEEARRAGELCGPSAHLFEPRQPFYKRYAWSVFAVVVLAGFWLMVIALMGGVFWSLGRLVELGGW